MSDPEIIVPDHDIPEPKPGHSVVPLASSNCSQVWSALVVAQGDFESPKRTKEAAVKGRTRDGREYEYKYKYAPLEEIERSIKPALKANGLFRQQFLVSRDEQWFIRTIIGHTSGEWTACDYPVYVNVEARNQAQAFASGVTFARRYGLSLALGLCPEDDDDQQHDDKPPRQPKSPRPEGSAANASVEDAADSDDGRGEPESQRHRRTKAEVEAFRMTAKRVAEEGTEPFRQWWRSLSKANRALITEDLATLQELATQADKTHPPPDNHQEKGEHSELEPITRRSNDTGNGDPANPAGDGEMVQVVDPSVPLDPDKPMPADTRDEFWTSGDPLTVPVYLSRGRPDGEMTKLALSHRLTQTQTVDEIRRLQRDSEPAFHALKLSAPAAYDQIVGDISARVRSMQESAGNG